MTKDDIGAVEADITINGVRLSFAESMTVRVALGSFLMHVSDPTCELGPIRDGYRRHLENVSRILHNPLDAEHERRRQERGFAPRTPVTGDEFRRELRLRFDPGGGGLHLDGPKLLMIVDGLRIERDGYCAALNKICTLLGGVDGPNAWAVEYLEVVLRRRDDLVAAAVEYMAASYAWNAPMSEGGGLGAADARLNRAEATLKRALVENGWRPLDA
jgi:hypothetical protein